MPAIITLFGVQRPGDHFRQVRIAIAEQRAQHMRMRVGILVRGLHVGMGVDPQDAELVAIQDF